MEDIEQEFGKLWSAGSIKIIMASLLHNTNGGCSKAGSSIKGIQRCMVQFNKQTKKKNEKKSRESGQGRDW